jgi:Putative PD-(D/E)XK phosphodiesterase (DUF2161)
MVVFGRMAAVAWVIDGRDDEASIGQASARSRWPTKEPLKPCEINHQGQVPAGDGTIFRRPHRQALAVANALAGTPGRPRELRILAPDAAKILQGNVYGWFERIERGVYGLTSSGRVALVTWAEQFPRG